MEKKVYGEYRDEDLVYNHLCFKELNMRDTGPQVHDIYEIIYLKKGTISYTVEGKSYYVKKGSLIFTRPEKRHMIQFNQADVYDRYDVLFDEKILHPEIYKRIPPEADLITFDNGQYLIELFERMDYYCTYFDGVLLKNVLSHLLEEIFYNIVIASKKLEKDLYTANPIVMEAVAYIERNLQNDINLEVLCEQLFITKSYLHQLFVKYLQISPKKYIITKRLGLAQREIRSGMKPTDVYIDCGFSNYSTFFRDYKKYFGYAPSEETGRKIIREIEY